MPQKLRGRGPTVFISYSFGNNLALNLGNQLSAEGFQVTLVDDKTLLGKSSLKEALDALIRASEYVVPLLDTKANESQWVLEEISSAKQHGVTLIPIVLDHRNLAEPVKDIPYVTADNLHFLPELLLRDYLLLPLDAETPVHFASDPLKDYMERDPPWRRTLLDTDDLSGSLAERLDATVVAATKEQPELESTIRRHASHLQRLSGYLDILAELMPLYRVTLLNTLQDYGRQKSERSLASWHSVTALLIGRELVHIARTLPPELFPDYWGLFAPGMAEVQKEWQEKTSSLESESDVIWAMECEKRHQTPSSWVVVEFKSSRGWPLRSVIPDSPSTQMGIRLGEPPSRFLESYEWADYCVPQLFCQAIMLREKRGNPKYTSDIVWNISDYIGCRAA